MAAAPGVELAECAPPHSFRRTATTPTRAGWLLTGPLFAFLVTAAMYSVVVPIWEAPDEPEHFQYVRFLIEQHILPTRLPTIQTDGSEEGKQPPLYYLLAFPFAVGVDLGDADRIRLNPHLGWPHDPAVAAHVRDEGLPFHGVVLAAHRIRLLSVLLGAATVALTYGLASTSLRSRHLALLAAALVALLPGFLFASATIDNDMLVNACSAALLFLVFRVAGSSRPWRPALAFGVLGSVALMSKLDAAIPLAVGVVALWARSSRHQRRQVLPAAVVPLVPALLFWIWHIARGGHTLISSNVGWPPPWPGSSGPLNWGAALQFMTIMWSTFFGAFGWPNVWLPAWTYALYGLVYGGGTLIAVVTLGRRREAKEMRSDLLVLLGWFGAVLAAVAGQPFFVYGNFSAYGHSRYLYLALPAIATLATYGWCHAAAHRPRLRLLLAPTLILATAGAAAIPWVVIRPAYPPPYSVGNRLPTGATPVAGVAFEQSVTLAGTRLPATPTGAGQGIWVTFYWCVQHPLPDGTWLFVHVEDHQGRSAAAFDGVPLYGQFPLSFWRAGDVVEDREQLTLHPDAASGAYVVKVGWYDPKTGRRVPLVGGGSDQVAGTMQVAARTARRQPAGQE